jgi:hypothetical protein
MAFTVGNQGPAAGPALVRLAPDWARGHRDALHPERPLRVGLVAVLEFAGDFLGLELRFALELLHR